VTTDEAATGRGHRGSGCGRNRLWPGLSGSPGALLRRGPL